MVVVSPEGAHPSPAIAEYAVERLRLILKRVRDDGRVNVRELATWLRVTPETIRRDLSELERRSLVRRVHGGAIPVGPESEAESGLSGLGGDLALRSPGDRIARVALNEVPQSGAMIIDGGTVSLRLASMLPTDRGLLVVIRRLAVAAVLARAPGVTAYMLGGVLDRESQAIVGISTEREPLPIVAETVFLSSVHVSVEHGVTSHDVAEAAAQRALVAAARRLVVLADHTQVGNDGVARVAPLSAVHTLVSDEGLSGEVAARIRAEGPRVVLA